MNDTTIFTPEYKNWLTELKSKIRSAQLKAAATVNSAMIQFYWELGKMITEKQKETQWGNNFIEQLSKDLQTEFPDMKGFSVSNLKYCRQFCQFYEPIIVQQPVGLLSEPGTAEKSQQPVGFFGQHLVAQMPWGHNILIFSKSRDIHKPMGVSEFELTGILPEDLKSSLPTVEEIENELMNK